MDLTLGLRDIGREINVEIKNEAEAQTLEAIRKALSGEIALLDFTDARGARHLISSAALAYVRIGEKTSRRVGFEL